MHIMSINNRLREVAIVHSWQVGEWMCLSIVASLMLELLEDEAGNSLLVSLE